MERSDFDRSELKVRDEPSDNAYGYKPLAEDEIRLIRCQFEPEVCLDLQHHLLNRELHPRPKVPYQALSYCWGDLNDLCDIAVKGGYYLRITRRLKNTLEQIRSFHPNLSTGLWWIDQICIDQNNIEERNDQVHRMWRTFSGAMHVYAWIGEDTTVGEDPNAYNEGTWYPPQSRFVNSPLVATRNRGAPAPAFQSTWQPSSFRVEKTLRQMNTDDDSAAMGARDMLVVALSKSGWTAEQGFYVDKKLAHHVMAMLDQPYFSRTWIVPEMLQARDLTFLFGSRYTLVHYLDAALDVLFRSGWKWDVQKLVKIKQLLEMRDERSYLIEGVSKRSTFLAALELLHETSCANIRDRVFAALSIPGLANMQPRYGLQPDYRLSRDEITVLAIAYYDKLDEPLSDMRRLSRTLARSLMLGDGTNITAVYHADVAASVLSCTRPWTEGEHLFFQSGVHVCYPGPCMKLYLSR